MMSVAKNKKQTNKQKPTVPSCSLTRFDSNPWLKATGLEYEAGTQAGVSVWRQRYLDAWVTHVLLTEDQHSKGMRSVSNSDTVWFDACEIDCYPGCYLYMYTVSRQKTPIGVCRYTRQSSYQGNTKMTAAVCQSFSLVWQSFNWAKPKKILSK